MWLNMGGLKKKKRVENNDHKRRVGNPGPLAEQVIKTNEGKKLIFWPPSVLVSFADVVKGLVMSATVFMPEGGLLQKPLVGCPII